MTQAARRPIRHLEGPLTDYLEALWRVPLLTAEEEVALARRARAGDAAARDRLITANLRLGFRIAKRFGSRVRSPELSDLVQEASRGVMRAADRYDPEMVNPATGRPFRFSTYASRWVQQMVLRAIDAQAWTIRTPTYLGPLLARWERAAASLRAAGGGEPTPEAVAKAAGLSPRDVASLRLVMAARAAVAVAEGGARAECAVADPATVPASRSDERAHDAAEVAAILAEIEPHLRAVVAARYGIGCEPRKLREIGAMRGVGRDRANQLLQQGLAAIRDRIAAREQAADHAGRASA